MAMVGLEFTASTFDPRLYFVFWERGGAVVGLTTHIDDVAGGREGDVLRVARKYLVRRFESQKVQGPRFAGV